MQYMHYDADKGEYVNRSIIFKSWKEEAIDILGGTRCGKIPFKDRSSLTPEQLEQQRTIRCYKLVYGLLSFNNGKTAQGNAHNVENLPALYRVTGTAFSPVSAALDQLKKRKKLMFNCTFTIDTKRQKKGGNVFYVPEIGVNADANLQLSEDDMETLKVFQESIDVENASVVDAYNSAKTKQSNVSDKIDTESKYCCTFKSIVFITKLILFLVHPLHLQQSLHLFCPIHYFALSLHCCTHPQLMHSLHL
jgi:hypothetical protein